MAEEKIIPDDFGSIEEVIDILGDLTPMQRRAALDATKAIIDGRRKGRVIGPPPTPPIPPEDGKEPPIQIQHVDPRLKQPPQEPVQIEQGDGPEPEIDDPDNLLKPTPAISDPQKVRERKLAKKHAEEVARKALEECGFDPDDLGDSDSDDADNFDDDAGESSKGHPSKKSSKGKSSAGEESEAGDDGDDGSAGGSGSKDDTKSGSNKDSDDLDGEGGEGDDTDNSDGTAKSDSKLGAGSEDGDGGDEDDKDGSGEGLSNEEAAAAARKLKKALKALKELSDEDLDAMDDAEFENMVNDVLDGASTLTPLVYTQNVGTRIKEIKFDVESGMTASEIAADSSRRLSAAEARRRTSAKKIKARSSEIKKYKPKSLEDFMIDFTKAIADQVKACETAKAKTSPTWSRMPRDRETGIFKTPIRPGTHTTKGIDPHAKKPLVQIYFDRSGSWGMHYVMLGIEAIQGIKKFAEEGKITLELYYFGETLKAVSEDELSVSVGGGYECWGKVIDNINASKANNVVIMTDSDIDILYSSEPGKGHLREYQERPPQELNGYVWYLWKTSSTIGYNTAASLQGRKGTSYYCIS